MNWHAHFAIGFAISLIVFYILNLSAYQLFILSVFSAASALLPDLDHKNSKAKEILDKSVIVIAAIFVYLNSCKDYSCILTENFLLRVLAFAGAYHLVFAYFKPEHRGITHSLAVAVLFSALIYFIMGINFALAGLIGYLSHLIADNQIKLL